MAEEPTLVFKLSRPEAFRCSACDEYCGAFDTEGWAIDVIDAFRDHVRRYHLKGEAAKDALRSTMRSTDNTGLHQ